MARSYEELTGAIGRAAFYRPLRSRVRDLLSKDASACVVVDEEEHPLYDLSMNGVSFEANGASRWAVGAEVDVSLQIHRRTVYEGRAKVVRMSQGRGGTRIALGLVRGFLDLPDIQRQDEEAALARGLSRGTGAYSAVPADYRAVIAEAALFAQHHRRLLDHHEARFRALGAAGVPDLERLERQAYETMGPAWDDLCTRAAETALPFLEDRVVLAQAKQLTETMLSPLLLACPAYNRGYTKPLGYAGDYRVMLFYYADSFEGPTTFDRVFHKIGINHPLAAGVRTRSTYLAEKILAAYDRCQRSATDPFRVMSLGCGPAREVSGFSVAGRRYPRPVEWVLIDQEEQALSVAFQDGKRAVTEAGLNAHLRCLNLSFSQIMRDPSLLLDAGTNHDVIFCSGLFDYIRTPTAQAVIAGLYSLLGPGGSLLVGNALGPNLHFWTPEILTDWRILYRTENEMREMAAAIPPEATLRIEVEPGGAYYFLDITRPGAAA